MLSKTLMFVPLIVLLYSNIKYAGGGGGGGGGGYLANGKGRIFFEA